MTPEQIKSYLFAYNSIQTITKERTFFNTNARVDLSKALYIFGALLDEDLLTKEQCSQFDLAIASLCWQLERPYFMKFKDPIFKAIYGMPHKARMNLYRKIRKRDAEREDLFLAIFGPSAVADTIDAFTNRYGGKDEMQKLLNFV